jgi:hypothetical protein
MSEYELDRLMSSNYVVKFKCTAKSHWITNSLHHQIGGLDIEYNIEIWYRMKYEWTGLQKKPLTDKCTEGDKIV